MHEYSHPFRSPPRDELTALRRELRRTRWYAIVGFVLAVALCGAEFISALCTFLEGL
jgi:hypothetical protein